MPVWRRVVGARPVVVGIAVAVGVSACSAAPGSGSGGEPPELVSSLPAAKGEVDLVTWNLTAGEPDTLFPPNAATFSGGQVVANLCDSLLTIDADYDLKPNLATPQQVDPLTIVYTVRDGVSFWDGSPVTAQDVAYSMNRAKDPASIVSFVYGNVKSIDVTAPNQVTVSFSQPDELFNQTMSGIGGMVMEQARTEQLGQEAGAPGGGLMCSGPFKLDSWRSGDGITISRNDNYWNTERRPFARQVRFTFVTDPTALAQALGAGEIDGAYEIPPSSIPALRGSPAGQLVFGPSTQSVSLYVANPGGVLGDVTLRQALQTIVDRDALARVVYRGAAEPDYTVLTPAIWPNGQKKLYQAAYDTFADERGFDVEKAKQLVARSSYRGQSIVLAIRAGDEAGSQAAQLVQQQAKQIGLTITINSLPSLVYDQAGYDASKRQGLDLLLTPSFNGTQDPLEPLGFQFLPGQVYNYTNYDNAEVTSLLTQARQTFDAVERAKKVIAAQEIFERESTIIPLVGTNTVTFLNNRLTGAVTSFAYWSTPQMAFVGAAAAG